MVIKPNKDDKLKLSSDFSTNPIDSYLFFIKFDI